MIVFDEFPLMSLLDSQGEVDPRVYPNFAEFAARSTWYRNATGIGGWTPHALPAMLSGRYPGEDRKSAAPNLSSYPDNLFTLFGHHYNLEVFETVTELCPADKCGQTGSPTAFTDLAKETAKVYKSIVWPIETAHRPRRHGRGQGWPNRLLRQPEVLPAGPGRHIRAFDQLLGPPADPVLPPPAPAARALEVSTGWAGLQRTGRSRSQSGHVASGRMPSSWSSTSGTCSRLPTPTSCSAR